VIGINLIPRSFQSLVMRCSLGTALSVALCPSVCPSDPCLQFSRNSKAVETSNSVETYRWTRITREENQIWGLMSYVKVTGNENVKVVFRAYRRETKNKMINGHHRLRVLTATHHSYGSPRLSDFSPSQLWGSDPNGSLRKIAQTTCFYARICLCSKKIPTFLTPDLQAP